MTLSVMKAASQQIYSQLSFDSGISSWRSSNDDIKKSQQKVSRHKKQPSMSTSPTGYLDTKVGRRKSLPNYGLQKDLSTPMTFGMLDPNDKSFLRNAHKKTSVKLRNAETTKPRIKSINRKESTHFKDSKLNQSYTSKYKTNKSSTTSRCKNKKIPQQDSIILPPLTSLPSSKSADQLETINKKSGYRGNRSRRMSGFTEVRNKTISQNQSQSRKFSKNFMKDFKNIPTSSPVSTPSSADRFRKITERRHNRRASMPVVLVNGKKEFYKKQQKLSPEAGRSDKGIEPEKSGEAQLIRSQPKIINQKKSSTRSNIEDHQNCIETSFDTIMVISPNKTNQNCHFVHGIPLKQESKQYKEELTQEKLLFIEEDEDEEDRWLRERIRRWLEEVATGEEACQEVHNEIVTSQSPEFREANAIIVVYQEDDTHKR